MAHSVVVQLIPVLIAGGRLERAQFILALLRDLAEVWPVGRILYAKAQRRIYYCTAQQQQQQQQQQHQ
jgi:hypothetical protein